MKANQPRTILIIPKRMLLFFHSPGCRESEKQRAEKFREHSCSQEVLAGALGELEEMFEQILKRKPILMRYVRRPNELLQQLDIVFGALYFYKLKTTTKGNEKRKKDISRYQ